MRNNTWKFPAIMMCLCVTIAAAQKGNAPSAPSKIAHIALTARVSPDSVVLRWAPTTPAGWVAGNAVGYIIQKATLQPDKKVVPGSARTLTLAPIKPWSMEVWKQRARRENQYAGVAAQALHGEHFSSKGDGLNSGTDLRNAATELSNRYAFALVAADNDPVAAEGLALRFVDHDVRPGFTYVYRVCAAAKDTTARLDTAYTAVSPAQFQKAPAVNDLSAEPGEHSVLLQWKNLPAGKAYSGFFISRSDDGGNHFTRLNQKPFFAAKKSKDDGSYFFTDSSAVNYRPYRYRVEGMTPFAETGEPAFVDGSAGDRTPPPAPIISRPEQLSPKAFKITWQMPSVTADLAGFAVYRSGFALKGYHLLYPKATDLQRAQKELLPPATRSFIDSASNDLEPYYVIGAVDTAGNMSQSLPTYGEIVDTLPPAIPAGLDGTIDTNGVVRLHWRLGQEPNLIGYRVLWSNDPSHEFTMRTNQTVADTFFVDTVEVRTLTRFVYYRVMAVNARKFFSKQSAMLALKRPDLVPPQSPLFTDVVVTDSIVQLVWAPSKSPDVRAHLLSRRKEGGDQWSPLATLSPRTESFVDRHVERRVVYEYQIEAVDSTGLHSLPSPTVRARPYDTGIRTGVTDLHAEKDARSGVVTVRWRYPSGSKEKMWFVVYRAIGEASLMELASVDGAVREYADARPGGTGPHKYAVKVLGDGGIESRMSTPVTVDP